MKKVSELEGAELDLMVAKARNPGIDAFKIHGDGERAACYFAVPASRNLYAPSSRWEQGGPIIEKHEITIRSPEDALGGAPGWEASMSTPLDDEGDSWCYFGRGATPLIAAMRAYVSSVFGTEVGA